LTTLLKTGMPEIAMNHLIYLGFERGKEAQKEAGRQKSLFPRRLFVLSGAE
jgi:hypothetical protein